MRTTFPRWSTSVHCGLILVLSMASCGGNGEDDGETGAPSESAQEQQTPNESEAGAAQGSTHATGSGELPDVECGHPVCEEHLAAVLPDRLDDLKLVRKRKGSEVRSGFGLGGAGGGPPLGHAVYTPSGEVQRGELTVNVNAQYHPKGRGAPTHVSDHPPGTVQGDYEGGGRQNAYFEVGGMPAKRTTWITGGGRLQSQINILVGEAIGVQVKFTGEHEPDAAQETVKELDLEPIVELRSN